MARWVHRSLNFTFKLFIYEIYGAAKIYHRLELLVFFLSTLGGVLFIAYIDEEKYSFEWIKEPLPLLVLLIYVISCLGSQLLIDWLIPFQKTGLIKTLISAALGPVIGIFLTIDLFYSN